MDFTLSDQMQTLLASFVSGLLLGIVYDLFRFFRTVVFSGKAATYICDVLFLIVFALFSTFFSMAYSFGRVRYFTLLSQLCGILLCRFTVGRFSVRVFGFVYVKIAGVLKEILIKSKKSIKKLLQPKGYLLYNKVKKKTDVLTECQNT